MPLNIKNDDAHRLAKELAELTGTSITEAVTIALKDAVHRARALRRESSDRLVSDLAEIAVHCASLPVLDGRSAEEILGYDERGLPG
jgi:antitoxin VapB